MTDEAPHILVVDDDSRLRELLRRYLSENGFRVSTAGDAGEARARLASMAFDLIVLDVMMPGETGLDLTADLRRSNTVPILLLTAMAETEDRINGLERGADDYLTKPFEPRELLLRIRTILRRVTPPAPTAGTLPLPVVGLTVGGLAIDLERLELRNGARIVRLTEAEAALLKVFSDMPGTALSRDELAQRLDLTGNPRTVDVQVTRLRRKIEPDPRFPRYLQTVRGKGYILLPD
ncbi:MAG: response regulator transcription factor [Alphaproteobacteria bacterium]|nr:response regulator transcription factor [Alphaproteobacteria bacterium]MBU0796508.1 response regulator transcription factor [Alphaproteobacteria bacterium]MBU0888078.1 response regulator transcription factor [Alphaproteobacteria bacterium]MBU1811523.1 response regulator transcription factor [Alphaproteobacteria bacterium]MBU2090336.1 response regulator transcription factor [Alphaproteobacteria bacterium]